MERKYWVNFTFTSVTNKVAFQSGHDYAPAFDVVHILRKVAEMTHNFEAAEG